MPKRKRQRRFPHDEDFLELIEVIRAEGYTAVAVADDLDYVSPDDDEELEALKDELDTAIEQLQEAKRDLVRRITDERKLPGTPARWSRHGAVRGDRSEPFIPLPGDSQPRTPHRSRGQRRTAVPLPGALRLPSESDPFSLFTKAELAAALKRVNKELKQVDQMLPSDAPEIPKGADREVLKWIIENYDSERAEKASYDDVSAAVEALYM
jgi:hypothetical protein